jgi:hypothetical protein
MSMALDGTAAADDRRLRVGCGERDEQLRHCPPAAQGGMKCERRPDRSDRLRSMLGFSRRRFALGNLANSTPRGTVAVSFGVALSDQPCVEKPCGASLFWRVALALAEVSNEIMARNTVESSITSYLRPDPPYSAVLPLAHPLEQKGTCSHGQQVFLGRLQGRREITI